MSQDGYTDSRCNIRASLIPGAGYGLFATSHILSRTLLCSYSGRFTPSAPVHYAARHVVYVPGRFGYVDGAPLVPQLLRGELSLQHVGSAFMANSSTAPHCRRLDLTWNAFHRRTGTGHRMNRHQSSLHTVVVLVSTRDVSPGSELTWNYPIILNWPENRCAMHAPM